MNKKIFLYFFSWKLFVIICSLIAIFVFPFQDDFVTDFEYRRDLPYYIWIWANFDGFHYMSISKHGYSNFQHAFFPLYPLLIAIGKLLGDKHIYRVTVGLLLSNGSFLFSLFLFYKLLLRDNYKKIVNLTLFIVIAYPTSLFYGAVYNDSLFLLLATGSLYLARKKSFLFSCICAALATLTRLNGLALVFPIILEYIQSSENIQETWNISYYLNRWKSYFSLKKIVQSKIYFIFLIPSAMIGYLVYIQVVYKDWGLVFSSMKAWDQDKVTFPFMVFIRYIRIILYYPQFDFIYWVAVLELLFATWYCFLIVYSYKKIRFSYWCFFTISILIPSLTGTFQGMPRYGLHLYPFFLTTALFLQNKNRFIQMLYFTLSLVLLFLFVGYFTRGYFIA